MLNSIYSSGGKNLDAVVDIKLNKVEMKSKWVDSFEEARISIASILRGLYSSTMSCCLYLESWRLKFGLLSSNS